MTLWLFLLGLAAGAAIGFRAVASRRKPPFLLHLEYWVYLPGADLPPQDAIMAALVRPTQGRATIDPAAAQLFSDVRLHVALVLRSKNAHVFRPDLLEPHVDATPDQLETLAQARSFAKVRFLSEEPVPDRRALAFLPQLARTVAELGGGTLVYDAVGERLLEAGSLREGDAGPHVRWVPAAAGGHVQTHGLKKVGLPEIRTAPVSADERWIVSEVIGQVARKAWETGELPPLGLAEAFDDRFQIALTVRGGVATARVHRVHRVQRL